MEIIEKLLELIKENGATVLITAIVLYFAIKVGNLLISEKQLKLERENDLRLNNKKIAHWGTLRSNPFFINMNHWIYYKIPNTNFGDPGRDLMIKDLLDIMYKQFRDELIKVVENPLYKELNSREFQSVMIKILSKGMHQFKTKSINEGIPFPLLELFSTYHEPNIEFIKVAIEGICNSGYHHTNAEKVIAILNIYSASFEITLSHGEKALRHLNGQLTGKKYKGIKAG